MDSNRYASLRMRSVWGLARGSSSVVVAVLDSGALFDHPEMRGRWLGGYDFVSNVSPPTGSMSQLNEGGSNDGDGRDADASDPGDAAPADGCSTGQTGSSFHGTAVASVLAANTDNAFGMAGLDGSARILPLRISGQCGLARTSDILDAMYWAVGERVDGLPVNANPARVVNLSFAGGLGLLGCSDTLFEEAIARLRERNAVFVTAAGNGGGSLESPASCAGAVAAGTVDADGFKASYSAYGPSTDSSTVLMTPADAQGLFAVSGNQQLSDGRPNPDGHTVSQAAGTSFSAPMLSGVFSLLFQVRPDMTPDQAIALLRSSAKAFPPSGFVGQCFPPSAMVAVRCACTQARCGSGIVSPLDALTQARALRVLANVPFSRVLAQSAPLRLDASLSSAANGGTAGLTYRWRQLSGPAYTLQGADSAVLQAAPGDAQSGLARFELQVNDAAGNAHVAQMSVLTLSGSTPTAAQSEAAQASTTQPTAQSASPSSSALAGGDSGGGGSLRNAIVLLLLGLGCLRIVHRPVFCESGFNVPQNTRVRAGRDPFSRARHPLAGAR
jgi:serine protease